MEQSSSFEQLIKEDRAMRESKRWRGPFLEYLEIVRQTPSVAKLAHARVHDMVMAPGAREILDTSDSRTHRLYADESVKVSAST